MTVISHPTRALLSLSMLKGVGPAALKRAAALSDVALRSIDDIVSAVPQVARALQAPEPMVWERAQEAAAEQIEKAFVHGARIISILDAEYPHLLKQTKDDPVVLFVKGRLAPRPDKSVAIIGTREPTSHGQAIAHRISNFFADEGWSIVSGLAIGCDCIAHESALGASAHTVAVLAHGLQTISPSRHQKLAEQILEGGGALVTEYRFGQTPQAQQFVRRDHTQAGMARGVVMVQSDLKGGSLHASRAALSYSRWLAVPYPTARDRGNAEPKTQANLLLADGSDEERTQLLRCSTDALKHIAILRGRDDYLRLIHASEESVLDSDFALLDDAEPSSSAGPQGRVPILVDEQGELGLPLHTDQHRIEIVPLIQGGWTSKAVAKPSKGAVHYVLDAYPIFSPTWTRRRLEVTQIQSSFVNSLRSSPGNRQWSLLQTRLRHIQSLLDDLTRKAESTPASESHFVAQISIEDVLTHMKRVTDALAQESPVTTSNVAGANDLTTASRPSYEDSQSPSFTVVLNEIVSELPRSVAFGDVAVVHETKTIELDELVNSFNGFVRQSVAQAPS